MDSDEKICNFVLYNLDKHETFKNVCVHIHEANKSSKLYKKIRVALTEDERLSAAYHNNSTVQLVQVVEPHFNKKKSTQEYATILVGLSSFPMHTETQRVTIYNAILNNIPQKMSDETAVKTLEILSNLFCKIDEIQDKDEKNRWQFASILLNPLFHKLLGIINQCLKQLSSDNPQVKLSQIIFKHNDIFKPLFIKVAYASLSNKLFVS